MRFLRGSHKLAQKDTDARWAKKYNVNHFGYKDHVGVDKESKLIVAYEVTPASSHDSTVFDELLSEGTREVWADSAYSHHMKTLLEGVTGHICKKSCRYKKLTKEEIAENHEISRTRCRVEHVFASIKRNHKEIIVRSVGMVRASFTIGMLNLAHNMRSFGFLRRQMAVMG